MKKTLLFAVVPALLLFSCKKEHSPQSKAAQKLYKVNLNVTNFHLKQSTFSLRHGATLASGDTLTNLGSYLDVLYYVVYNNADGQAVRMPLMQDSTMANMGMITDSLPAGSYEIAIIAGKKGLAINRYGLTASANFGYGNYFWQDTFWDVFTLTVGSSNVSQDVTLKRVVSKLEVQITDAVPASADSLSITIDPEVLSKQLDLGIPTGLAPTEAFVYTVPIPAAWKGQPNFTVNKIIGNTQNGINTITLKYKDAGNHIIDTAVINNVQFVNNTKIILSGNLCTTGMGGSTSPQSFTVKADTAWGGSSQINFGLRRH
jgi:hypothetical protein